MQTKAKQLETLGHTCYRLRAEAKAKMDKKESLAEHALRMAKQCKREADELANTELPETAEFGVVNDLIRRVSELETAAARWLEMI